MYQIYFVYVGGKKILLGGCPGYEVRRWPPDMEGSCEYIE
jgi:hypothetical protein